MAVLRASLAALALATSGCAPIGILYSNTTVPLDVDYDELPISHQGDGGDTRGVQYYIRVEWGDVSIGELAEKYDFDRIHYADVRILSVLTIWRQRFVTIYGERSAR